MVSYLLQIIGVIIDVVCRIRVLWYNMYYAKFTNPNEIFSRISTTVHRAVCQLKSELESRDLPFCGATLSFTFFFPSLWTKFCTIKLLLFRIFFHHIFISSSSTQNPRNECSNFWLFFVSIYFSAFQIEGFKANGRTSARARDCLRIILIKLK